MLKKLPSLGLRRGVKCGRRIHGHSVTSFTVQKSFVMCIRVSELHLTACSLMDCPFDFLSTMYKCLPLQLLVTHVNVISMSIFL